MLFEVFSDGAKILSRDTMGDVWHWIPALKSMVETIIQLKVLLVSQTTENPTLFDQKRQPETELKKNCKIMTLPPCERVQEQHTGGVKRE